MELTDMQSDYGLREKLISVKCTHYFRLPCHSKYNNFKD